MSEIRAHLLKKLYNLKPIDQIYHLYEEKSHFNSDLQNYLRCGYLHSCDDIFVMAKKVDCNQDPFDQWFVEKPNCWFVRWASGTGGLKKMMDSVEPMEWVMFKRVRENGHESEYRICRWERLYKLVERQDNGK